MRILKIIGLFLLGILLLLAVLGLILPKEYTVERQLEIAAPPALVFKHIGSLKAVHEWSPWKDMDPEQVTTFEGEDGAVGSSQSWSGNKDVGKGTNTITAVEPGSRVETHLVFIEPFASESDTWMQVADAEGGSTVTWGMKGAMPFPWNVIGVLMGMKGAIAKDFDKGLEKLKMLAEAKASQPVYRGYPIQTVDLPARTYLGYRAKITFDQMQQYFNSNMAAIYRKVQSSGGTIAGPPVGLFYEWDMENQTSDLATAVPVEQPMRIEGVTLEEMPAGKAVVVDYYGPYDGSGEAHFAIDDYLKDFGLTVSAPVVEEYISDPTTEPDTSKWHTRIIYNLK